MAAADGDLAEAVTLVGGRAGDRLDDQVERALQVTGVHRGDDVG